MSTPRRSFKSTRHAVTLHGQVSEAGGEISGTEEIKEQNMKDVVEAHMQLL